MLKVKVPIPICDGDEESEKIFDLGFRVVGARQAPSPTLSPEEILRAQEAKQKINEILRTLSPREEKVVRAYFMGSRNLKEAAQTLGTSKQRVRQIIAKALRKLRSPERANVLQNL